MRRRTALRAGLTWTGLSLLSGPATLIETLAAQCAHAPLGELLGFVRLQGDRPFPTPLGELVGGPGLDARKFTDLGRLDVDRLVTPEPEMFVRTAAPESLRTTPTQWPVTVDGLTANRQILQLDAIRHAARPQGAHLIECAGNADPDNFGLMSVAEWDGVLLSTLMRDLAPRAEAWAVVVRGVDEHLATSRSSLPGASWAFPLAELERLGAFLATGMNGAPLTPDHGAPLRLVVPGWYGCSWIKWVQALTFVDRDEPSTPQMLEFARRTHQEGAPALARDFTPPLIDTAAVPIRIEKRRINGALAYRVVGIVWGGDRPVSQLAIRFGSRGTPVPFTVCPAPATHRIWSLWDYWWRPEEPGIYPVALTAPDRTIRTRRLDLSYYIRRVVIDEV